MAVGDTTVILRKMFLNITPNSNESDVEQKVVIPLLHLLGYKSEDWQSQVVILQSKLDFNAAIS